jgi:hypothetical protein
MTTPGTIVHTLNGNIKICDLKSDNVELIDPFDRPVKLITNIKLPDATKFVKIPKSALGENSPSKDLHIIDGHPIWIGGQEILPSRLIGQHDIAYVELESKPIYTLVTEKRTFVLINNVYVCTWSQVDIAKQLGKVVGIYEEN